MILDPAAAPEERLIADNFARVFGHPPATVRRAPGTLPLLPGLTVGLPWGALVAATRTEDGSFDLYSMNHCTERFTTHVQPDTGTDALSNALPDALGDVPHWATEPVAALLARPVPGIRLTVNRELPAQMGLLSGAETVHAVHLALKDLYGPPSDPYTAPARPRKAHALLTTSHDVEDLPCDLAAAGLRLLIIEVGAPLAENSVAPADTPDAAGTAERAAAALRAGRPADLGPLLGEAHVTAAPAQELALATAIDAGALGGRVIGACAVALVPLAAVQHVRQRVTAALADRLPRPPRYLTVVPG